MKAATKASLAPVLSTTSTEGRPASWRSVTADSRRPGAPGDNGGLAEPLEQHLGRRLHIDDAGQRRRVTLAPDGVHGRANDLIPRAVAD